MQVMAACGTARHGWKVWFQLDFAMPILLDLRHLPPPEPMERILDAVQALRRGECIEALTPFWPAPLLPILESQGCAWRRTPSASGDHARITIFLREDAIQKAAA